MAIKKFEDKSLSPRKELAKKEKNAKIELKEFCYPDEGVTIKAYSKEEADEKLKNIIN